MAQSILEITDLRKRYRGGETTAIAGVSFSVSSKERIAIIGSNGSGKTTLFRLILNLIRPDGGNIKILGSRNLEEARRFVGYLPEHQGGLENFTPGELLNLAGRMMGLTAAEADTRADRLLEWAGLDAHRDELLQGFSKGMIQRLQLAQALIHQPPILLLDEPMSGLDPDGQATLREMLQQLTDQTLLLATHRLEEVEWLCQKVFILHRGKLVRELDLSAIREQLFSVEAAPGLMKVLERIPGITIRRHQSLPDGESAQFQADQATFQKVLQICSERKIDIRRFQSRSILEDLYHQYVTDPESDYH